MAEIILHHYPRSPYAEKVRLALGLKELTYHSVTIPSWMPKPDLIPLTGGYRRTPVMQVGADVFCDTLIILRQIERMYPSPHRCFRGDPRIWPLRWDGEWRSRSSSPRSA